MNTLVAIISAAFISLTGLLGFSYLSQPEVAPSFGSTFNPAGGLTYRLNSSIGTSDTTLTLSSFKNRTNIGLTMSNLNTDIAYATIDPQSSRSEFISFTGVTQNSDGTATITGVTRGLADIYPFSASTTMRQTHPGQSIFILSDSPSLFNEYYVLRNNSTSTGILVFSSTTPPRLDATAAQGTGTFIATTSEFASVEYVNEVALTSAPNAGETVKGVVELATALESASSTILGSTGAGLVLQARYATETPQNCTSVGCIVVSNIGGKIRQSFLDLTEHFIFTSLFATSASSTNATTTSRFALPFITSSLLKTDSVGSVVAATAGTDYQRQQYTFATTSNLTVVGVSGTSTFLTIPASTLTASSTIIVRGSMRCTDAAGGGTCGVLLKAGDATIASASNACTPSTGAVGDGTFVLQTLSNNSTASQTGLSFAACNISSAGASTFANEETSSTVDLSAATTLSIVFSADAAGGNSTGILFNYSIQVTP